MRALASRLAIGGEVSARRPSQIPIPAAISHHPAATGTTSSSSEPIPPARVTAASALAAAALIKTVVFRKSAKRTYSDQQLEQLAHSRCPLHDDVGLGGDPAGSLVGVDADADRARQRALFDEVAKRTERIQIGHVIANVQRDVNVRAAQE